MFMNNIGSNNQNQVKNLNNGFSIGKTENISNNVSFGNRLESDIADFSIKIKENQNVGERILNSLLRFTGIIPSKKQIQPNIEFKEAQTLDEAIKFGKKTLGIKEYVGFDEEDLDTANWINEGLVNCINAQGGKIAMSKKIINEEIKESYAKINLISQNLSIDAEQYRNLKYMIDLANRESGRSEFSTIYHEMGHLQHSANLSNLFLILSLGVLSNEEIKELIKDKPILKNLTKNPVAIDMIENFKKSGRLADEVSGYAGESIFEYVAECYSKMVDGIKLSDSQMKLYIKLGGIIN